MNNAAQLSFDRFFELNRGAIWRLTDKETCKSLPLFGDCNDLVAGYLIEYFGWPESIRGLPSVEVAQWMARQNYYRSKLDERPIKQGRDVSSMYLKEIIIPGGIYLPYYSIKTSPVHFEVRMWARSDQKVAEEEFKKNGFLVWLGTNNGMDANKRHIMITRPGEIPSWLTTLLATTSVTVKTDLGETPCLELRGVPEPFCSKDPLLVSLAYHLRALNSVKWATIQADGSVTSNEEVLNKYPGSIEGIVNFIPVIDLRVS